MTEKNPDDNRLLGKESNSDTGFSWRHPLRSAWRYSEGLTNLALSFYTRPTMTSDDGQFEYSLINANTILEKWRVQDIINDGNYYCLFDRTVSPVTQKYLPGMMGYGWMQWSPREEKRPHSPEVDTDTDILIGYGLKIARQILEDAKNLAQGVSREDRRDAQAFIDIYQPYEEPVNTKTGTLNPYSKVQP